MEKLGEIGSIEAPDISLVSTPPRSVPPIASSLTQREYIFDNSFMPKVGSFHDIFPM
jgi:hypothetical protein